MTRHRPQSGSRLGALLIGAAFLMSGGVPAWGATQTYNVNSTADLPNSSSSSKLCATAGSNPVCTLRAAIQASNANSGTDTIVLPPGVYKLTIAGRNEDAAATGDLDITDPVNITGAAASSVIIDGNGIDRVFDVFPNGTVTISGVTIQNGNPGGLCSITTTRVCLAKADCPQPETCNFAPGGGILTGGIVNNTVALYLTNAIVTKNTSGSFGGGIANTDDLWLTDVTVSDNACASNSCLGGGIYTTGGTATLNGVTLSGNSASGGGGICSDFDVNLTNVTMYNNDADAGAAIQHDSGTATLVNVTISNNGNNSAPGSGAFFNLGDVAFKYTIFAHNPASEACQPFEASFRSGGHNIDVGTSCEPPCAVSSDCPSGTTCTSNLCQGTGDIINTDPGIAPLANNGGPTFTQALVAGSPALDKGGADCPPPQCDQRGVGRCSGTTPTGCCQDADCSGQTCVGASVGAFPRPGTGSTKCDIGAFEHRSTDPFPTTTTSTTTSTTTTTTTRPPTTTTSTTTTQPLPTTSTTSTTTTTTRPPTTTTTTSTTTTTRPTALCGDVNGDGAVNVGDALVTAQYDARLRTCGQAPFSHPEVCDVNHDGACNIGDALRMAQCDAGLISCTFTCTPFSCP